MNRKARAAFLVGIAAAFVAALALLRLFGIAVVFGPDPGPAYALYRFGLVVAIAGGAGAAGVLAAAGFLLWAEGSPEIDGLPPALELPGIHRGWVLAALFAAALAFGAFCRFVDLERLPPSLWVDDLSLIRPALALTGSWSDFSDAIRPAPYGVAKPFGSVGVLYLEAYRASLEVFGATVFGVRFPAAAAGVLSIATVFLLARSLLPTGGAALAALIFAGLRWNLIVSRWGWNAVVVGPLADLAALLLISARSRGRSGMAAAAGFVAGLAAHVYLAAWCVAAALLGLALWPSERPESRSPARRLGLALAFSLAFAAVVAPLFLLHEGRTVPYFARASQQTRKLRADEGAWTALASAADGIAAPWFLADPEARHDVPGRTRLGWLLGVPVAVAIGRALCRPTEETSGFFLCHAGAALAASIASGGVPNGYRFGYLADVTAVAAAAGLLLLTSRAPFSLKRGAALAAVGLAAIGSAAGARDTLLDWSSRRSTFQGFRGQDTLLARAALRWDRYGPVEVGALPLDSPVTFEAVVRYRLDPDGARATGESPARSEPRRFRLAPAGSREAAGERRVETVADGWGRQWGIVFGRNSRSDRIGRLTDGRPAADQEPTGVLVQPANSSSDTSN